MTLTELQRAALILFAAREVGTDGSLDHMKAVCCILRNRVKAGWHDDFLTAVEEAAAKGGNAQTQEPVKLNVNDRRLALLARDIEDLIFGSGNEIEAVCDEVKKEHGMAQGPILHWAFIDRPLSPWFEKTIAGDPANHRQRGQIGFMYLYE